MNNSSENPAMTVTVETLEKLQRRITLTLPMESITGEVESRLRKLARTVRADGFRPGKVPMSVVAQRYGYSVQYEVMNDKVGEAFNAAANEARLRVAGAPKITQKEESAEGQMAFDATFEVYPDVRLGDLSQVSVERHHRGDRCSDRQDRRDPAQAAPHLRPTSGRRGCRRRRPRDDRLRGQDRRRAVRRRQGGRFPVHRRGRADAAPVRPRCAWHEGG
jgi:hypothetical protein